MAVVYLAHDSKFGVQVALKVAPALRANAYAEFKARFVREARIGYLLGQQEGFVRALDWGDLPGGDLYLAADLVPDATALDLRAGLRPLPERLAVLRRAAWLVGRVHAHGIVHRDVKPANFLVSGSGALFLTDFGLAKVLGKREEEQEILGYTLRTGRDVYLGTPQFMPPEQFEAPGEVDPRADIYALGVMLFHCVTGRYPYDVHTGVQLICKHLAVRDGEEPLPRPRDVDPRIDPVLDELCAAALAIEPAERPSSVDEFLERLSRSSDMIDRDMVQVPATFVAAMRRTAARRHPVETTALPSSPPRTRSPGEEAVPITEPPSALQGVLADAIQDDGFSTRGALHEVRRRVGHDGFRRLLAGAAAVRVQDEREFQGRVRYLGSIGLLRRRAGVEGASGEVCLGRSRRQADLVFDLPTVSGVQLRFRGASARWNVVEAGSRNGTELNGVRLDPGTPAALRDGDVLYVSKHLTLVFMEPESLDRWLVDQG